MKKCILWLLGILVAILLIGSFPVRSMWGTAACDLMRLAGFALLFLFSVLRLIWQKDISSPNPQETPSGKIRFFVLILVCTFIMGLTAGLLVGMKLPAKDISTATFYATIEEIDSSHNLLLVQGMDVNDINYRGKFWVEIDEDTELFWRGITFELSDLEPGDPVSVTFTGLIAEVSPAIVEEPIIKLTFLGDEL